MVSMTTENIRICCEGVEGGKGVWSVLRLEGKGPGVVMGGGIEGIFLVSMEMLDESTFLNMLP